MDPSGKPDTRATFDQGLVAFYDRLFPLAFRLCRNEADARDLVQDAVERGLRHRGLFRHGDAPDRWICTILRRIFLDGYRARHRRAGLVPIDDQRALAAPGAEPEAPRASEAFTLEDVETALGLLDPASRETFRLFAFENLAQGEIAQRLSISRRTVATRVFRTRGKLRELLTAGAHRQPARPRCAGGQRRDPDRRGPRPGAPAASRGC
jgi:RNA polymerase sigma factor (sigma-70 family)